MQLAKDHPRVCGEKPKNSGSGGPLPGSPPRVRGKADKISRTKLHTMDHPRVCGEKKDRGEACQRSAGSPPRVRGKD